MKSLSDFKKLTEKTVDITTSDFKINPTTGRKVRAHRFKVGEKPEKPEEAYPEWIDPSLVKQEQITEVLASAEPDPPYVLILQRKAIRLYPNEVRVALYYNKQLNKYFSVPYGLVGQVNGIIQAEEKEPNEFQRKRNDAATSSSGPIDVTEAVIDQLHQIVDGKSAKAVKFATGETRKVDHFTASALTQVHKALNDENKKKFADMVHKSPAHLMKAAEFAFKHVK
jgi:hypothetical protein